MLARSAKSGYKNLSTRVVKDHESLQAMRVEKGCAVYVEDAFFGPASLWRSFQLCTKQPLGSALNHLQLVGETLSDRGEPHSFAQDTHPYGDRRRILLTMDVA